jgi:Domain of unknown function (DUF4398)
MNATPQSHRATRLLMAIGLTGTLTLAACASTPPTPAASLQAAQSLQAAEQSVSNAERVEAGRYAPGELAEARSKLASAYTAVSEQKMAQVEQLAEQSHVEADLATAKTANVKAKAVNKEMRRSTGTLLEEMQRNSGEKE